MKVKVGYTIYKEMEIEVDEKFECLAEKPDFNVFSTETFNWWDKDNELIKKIYTILNEEEKNLSPEITLVQVGENIIHEW